MKKVPNTPQKLSPIGYMLHFMLLYTVLGNCSRKDSGTTETLNPPQRYFLLERERGGEMKRSIFILFFCRSVGDCLLQKDHAVVPAIVAKHADGIKACVVAECGDGVCLVVADLKQEKAVWF